MTYEQFKEKWGQLYEGEEFGDFTRDLTRLCVGYQVTGYDNGVLQAKHLAHIVEQMTEVLCGDN